MTCATCKGTKVVRSIERVGTPAATYIAEALRTPTSRLIEGPCPDCTPKPFASAVRNEQWSSSTGWDERVEIGGPGIAIRLEEGNSPAAVADAINAIVEQREAKLRGPLAALSKCVERFAEAGRWEIDHACAECIPHSDCLVPGFQCGRHAALAALGPNPPAYVAADEHEAVKKTLRDARVTIDALDDGSPTERAVIAPFLIAMGLRSSLESLTDEQLAAEVKRRDALEKVVHVFAEHEYGFADRHHTLTGKSFCGLELKVGGRWTAITQNDFNSGPAQATCAACLRVARERDAAVEYEQEVDLDGRPRRSPNP